MFIAVVWQLFGTSFTTNKLVQEKWEFSWPWITEHRRSDACCLSTPMFSLRCSISFGILSQLWYHVIIWIKITPSMIHSQCIVSCMVPTCFSEELHQLLLTHVVEQWLKFGVAQVGHVKSGNARRRCSKSASGWAPARSGCPRCWRVVEEVVDLKTVTSLKKAQTFTVRCAK